MNFSLPHWRLSQAATSLNQYHLLKLRNEVQLLFRKSFHLQMVMQDLVWRNSARLSERLGSGENGSRRDGLQE
jgi:hypothetical protein